MQDEAGRVTGLIAETAHGPPSPCRPAPWCWRRAGSAASTARPRTRPARSAPASPWRPGPRRSCATSSSCSSTRRRSRPGRMVPCRSPPRPCGRGAVLVDAAGARVMAGIAGAELAPRDVVARAIAARTIRGEAVFLDARRLDVARRFPHGGGAVPGGRPRPAAQPIPVRPAAHYHMGGIRVDGTAGPRSRASGPAARSPPRGCTGRTASPATRSSRRWPSQARSRRTSRPALPPAPGKGWARVKGAGSKRLGKRPRRSPPPCRMPCRRSAP